VFSFASFVLAVLLFGDRPRLVRFWSSNLVFCLGFRSLGVTLGVLALGFDAPHIAAVCLDAPAHESVRSISLLIFSLASATCPQFKWETGLRPEGASRDTRGSAERSPGYTRLR
jgi:hypothetical protein